MKWNDVIGCEAVPVLKVSPPKKLKTPEENLKIELKPLLIQLKALDWRIEEEASIRAARIVLLQLNQDEEILDSSESTYSSRAVLLDFDPEDHIDN